MFINSSEDFIYHRKGLLSASLCKSIIDYFENNPNKHPGIVYKGSSDQCIMVDPEVKESMDLSCNFAEIKATCLFHLHHHLFEVINEYKTKYEFLNGLAPWKLFSDYNIQKYPPKGGYFSLHSEHGAGARDSRRIMAWMIYLNDVYDGGYTNFPTQKKKFQPRVGDALIWPAFWTHPHQGITSKTQTKYIATGWISYVEL